MKVLTVVPGPEGHGVVRHAHTVARLLRDRGVVVTVCRDLTTRAPEHDLTHAHFTDALYGSDAASAAQAYVRWAGTAPRPLVVTLHDVPGEDPDPARDARRRQAYALVSRASDAVVTGSEHEAVGARLVDPAADPVVVPLPVEPLVAPGPRPAWADRPTVGVLGFVYPGKGHAEAIAAAAGPGARVVGIGGVSPGHAPLLADLRAQAARARVDLVVTGPLDEADLHAAVLATTVPLAAYRTLGSSASIATWLACGRRVVATSSAQTREVAARWPDSLVLTAGDPTAAVAAALADPAGTWLDGAPPRPDVAAGHLAVFAAALA